MLRPLQLARATLLALLVFVVVQSYAVLICAGGRLNSAPVTRATDQSTGDESMSDDAALGMPMRNIDKGDSKEIRAASKSFDDRKLMQLLSRQSAELKALVAENDRREEQTRGLSARFQAIALDESRTNDERRAAILAVGQLGDDESLDFLSKHLALYVAVDVIVGDTDVLDSRPCFRALISARWKAIPAVLRHLQHERSPWALAYSTALLRGTLGTEAATAVVKARLRQATEEQHIQYLREVLKQLPQR